MPDETDDFLFVFDYQHPGTGRSGGHTP
jgi:hypothetical protein